MIEHVKVNGEEHWYEDGKLHRDSGPAIICPNGDRYWYKYGTMISCDCPSVLCRPLNITPAIVKIEPVAQAKGEIYPARYLIVGVIIALVIANIVAHFL
jgi:hypothetical protein